MIYVSMLVRGLLLLAFAAGTTGCGVKFIYNNVDRFAKWQIEDHVELREEQEAYLDAALDATLHWHRTEELPVYAELLRDIAGDLQDGMTLEELDAVETRVKAAGKRIEARVLPLANEFLLSLDDAQVATLGEKLAEDREKDLAEHAKTSAEELREDFVTDYEKGARRVAGRLNDVQRAILREETDAYVPDAGLWLTYEGLWQQDFLDLLTLRGDPDAFTTRFYEMAEREVDWAGPEYRAALDGDKAFYRRLGHRLLGELEPRQRERLNDRLEAIAEDFDELAAEADEPPEPLRCFMLCDEPPATAEASSAGMDASLLAAVH